MNKEEALNLANSNFWEGMTYRERAMFQINEPRPCMPFDVFHEAVEKTLGRPVWTHEFSLNWEGLRAEVNNGCPPPTMEEIMNLIPKDKSIIVIGT